jgi:hypothetical protein
MKRLEVSGAVRPLYGSLGVEGLTVIRLTRRVSSGHLTASGTDAPQLMIVIR